MVSFASPADEAAGPREWYGSLLHQLLLLGQGPVRLIMYSGDAFGQDHGCERRKRTYHDFKTQPIASESVQVIALPSNSTGFI